ncbi:MAG: aspartate aminotransferase family protein [Rhodospirillales bacterium]|jgi:acetylornithine/N-succinyldiaminopimelate aminotransferase
MTVTDSVMPTYGVRDIAFDRGEGVYLMDTAGRRFLDCGSGIAVTSVGHAHPHLVQALKAQAEKVWHTSNLYEIPGQKKAAQRLTDNSFADLAFFCNSGAEANEAMIKIIRKGMAAKGHPEKHRIITIEGAFHGRTLGTLAAGNNPKHLEGFGPKVEGFDHVPFGNLNALRDMIGPATAGVIVEPVQGEGGIRAMDIDYIKGVRAACNEFGIFMGVDEVQCGMGRTGKLFAYEWSGVKPDVMALAKGLGGGFPVGACLATSEAAAGMIAGTHGSTFGGNPLAAAAVNAVLDILLAEGFLEEVQRKAKIFRDGLEAVAKGHPNEITEVRGMGLMLGARVTTPNGEVVAACRKEGLLTVPAGDNVVRFLPPLIISEAEIAEVLGAFDRALKASAKVA